MLWPPQGRRAVSYDGGSFAYSRNGPSNSAEVEEGLSSEVDSGDNDRGQSLGWIRWLLGAAAENLRSGKLLSEEVRSRLLTV